MAKLYNRNALKIERHILSVTGVWPWESPNLSYKIWSVSNYLLTTTLTIALFVNIFTLKNLMQFLGSGSMFVSSLNYTLRISAFRLKRTKFLELLKFLKENRYFSNIEDPNQYIDKSVKKTERLATIFLCCTVTTVLNFSVFLFLEDGLKQHLELSYVSDASEIAYVFASVFVAFGLVSTGWNTAGFDNVPISIMGLISAYLKILSESVEGAIKEENGAENFDCYRTREDAVNRRLYRFVEQHLAIIELTKLTEDVFSYVFLIQFIHSIFCICLMGFVFLNAPPGSSHSVFGIIFLTTLMFQISLCCAYGNEVTVQSLKIREACYFTNWYCCSPLIRRTLCTIMENSKRPLILTSGKFFTLSLSSLLSIFRTAYSYGTVLKNVTKLK